MNRRPKRRLWIIAGIIVVAALAGLNAYSECPRFCGSCHGVMGPYYRSWRASSHSEIADCLDCHSDPGWVGYYHCKVEGVRNVMSHFFGVEKDGEAEPPGRAACTRPGCHESDVLTTEDAPGRDTHARHLGTVACGDCHGAVGHGPEEEAVVRDCADCHGGGAEED